MSKKAVIIMPGYQSLKVEQQALAPFNIDIEFLDWGNDTEKLKNGVKDALLVFVRDTRLDKEIISVMNKAKGIVRYGVGIDNIDMQAATEKGIIVTRVPDYGADIEVADHAVSMMLTAKRKILRRDKQVRDGAWNVSESEPIKRIADATLGLLGYGKIARAVAHRMKAFGINNVIAYDPFLKQEQVDDATLVSLDELASQSDFLSLHAPATKENHHVISQQFLQSMKPDAIIANTARGALINEQDLFKHLQANSNFIACLDVFEHEPTTKDNPLFSLENTIVSDHTGWYSENTVATMQQKAAEQAIQILETGDASNRVKL